MKLATALLALLITAAAGWPREGSLLLEPGAGCWGYPDSVVATVNPGQHPRDLCSLPDGSRVYVAVGFGLVTVIDTGDNSIAGAVSAGNSPRGICSLPGGDYVYLTDDEDHTVTVIRTSDNTITDVVDVPGSPWGICPTPDGQYVYVSHTGGFVSIIRTSDNVLVDSFYAGNSPGGICSLPNGEYVYVSDGSSPWDSMINTSTHHVTRFFTGLDTSDFEPSANGDYLYATVPGWNMVVEILTEDNSISSEYFDVGTDPSRLCVLPGLGYLYVTSPDDGLVFVISPASGGVIDTVSVGSGPDGICSLPSGDFLYVACEGSNRVDVIGLSETGMEGGATEGGPTLVLSPCPCNGTVTVTFTSEGSPAMLSVYDLSGRLVAGPFDCALFPAEKSVTIDGLPSGLHAVVLSTGSGTVSGRLVVLR